MAVLKEVLTGIDSDLRAMYGADYVRGVGEPMPRFMSGGVPDPRQLLLPPRPITKPTRRPIPEADMGNARVQLAVESAQMLGYRTLAMEMKVTLTLGNVLRDLDIHPYDPEEVDSYKEKQCERLLRESLRDKRVSSYYAWQFIPVNGYMHPIPEFALDTALRIYKRLPETKFLIDCIRERSHDDPFLVAAYQTEVYWVEVWDEPKFEGEQWQKRVEANHKT